MLINDLPNDCFLLIFNWIFDVQDLLRCYQVDSKWRQLIIYRLKRVRYLQLGETLIHSIDDETINYNCHSDNYRIDKDNLSLSGLLPNLKIVDVSNSITGCILDTLNYRRLLDMVKENVRGLIFPMQFDNTMDNMLEQCKNIEMIAAHCLGWRSRKIMIGRKIKQLYLNYDSLSYFENRIRYFPNLIRLHVYYHSDRLRLKPNNPLLRKLEIIELAAIKTFSDSSAYHGFRFMDLCPALKSAYHSFDCTRGIIDVTEINFNLQDLVIYYKFDSGQSWESLEKLLSNYPNLKHLALRKNNLIHDEHIIKVITLLPRLVLLDVRGSRWITQSSAENLRQFCSRTNRSVYFYHEPGHAKIQIDWSNLSIRHENISKGFDFMSNCFLKSFSQLPRLMDNLD
ncbi:uncharacterized protein LOC128396085 [Panonychus citri]|uniref:uncharacterized protein LOC128396085 n=1 Tax=Panonychus citri TaxID=50023 RepID=UPI002307E61F|nr:uncharacterized protein LOC128396085 [Panonychus citri]